MRRGLAVVLILLLCSCGDESFRVQEVSVGVDPQLALNQSIVIEFSESVEPRSFTAPAFRVRALDGGPDAAGRCEFDGRRVIFWPANPRSADGSDAGLRPGVRYALELIGPPKLRCVRSRRSQLLAESFSLEFRAAQVPAPASEEDWLHHLIDPAPGNGPRLIAREGSDRSSSPVLLHFSEPIDPRSLAGADFRLRGPWDPPAGSPQELWDSRVPRLMADLVENDPVGVLCLRFAEDPPAPLRVDKKYWIDFEPQAIRDFDGKFLPAEAVISTNPLLRWPAPDA